MNPPTFQRKQMVSDAVLLSKELRHPLVLMGDFNDRPIPVRNDELTRVASDHRPVIASVEVTWP